MANIRRENITSPRIEELRTKRKKSRLRLVVLLFILLISVILGLYYVSSYHRFTIHSIVVDGTSIINQDDVMGIVESNLTGRYLHIFARSNTLIYPKSHIYNALIKTFPRIENLSIYRDNWNTLHITILERSGSYLYCGVTVPDVKENIGENCYFMNNDGYIFDTAPYFSGNVYFKFYAPVSNTNQILGQQMISKEHFHGLVRFIDTVISSDFKPIYLLLSNTDDELYLNNINGATMPKIIFKDDADIESIVSNLSTAMSKSQFAQEIKDKYSTLLYIDLRFKNKVLYKFQ